MSSTNPAFKYKYFVRGDFDGFIGLFIDNLVNLLLITGLCLSIGMPAELVYGTILPATAISVLSGNIFYSFLARKLAIKEQRNDVTALPYGINTVSLFAFFSLIIVPVYIQTNNAELAWKAGVASCFISGIFEGLGAFVGEKMRSITPRAALLSTLAGIAIVFIALEHALKIWDKPAIAFIPMAFILIEYFAGTKLPFKIPAGFYALITGAVIAWTFGYMDANGLTESTKNVSFYFPGIALFGLFDLGSDKIIPFLSISIPLGLMSFFATLQNVESAAAAGDSYNSKPVLAMNGIGTIIGAVFGSPFPTTVYIGHPGWKGLGARTGYSIINGAVVTIICFSGLMGVITKIIPLEAGYPILLWIGVIITSQAFQSIPSAHAPAVALGLLPAIAAWGMTVLKQFINYKNEFSSAQINDLIIKQMPQLKGIITFSEGAMFTAMFLSAIAVYLIEKDLLKAFFWSIPLSILSYFGLIHSNRIFPGAEIQLAFGYILFSIVLITVYFYNKYFNNRAN